MENILLKSTVALLIVLLLISIYNTYKLNKLDEDPIENMDIPISSNMQKFYTPVDNNMQIRYNTPMHTKIHNMPMNNMPMNNMPMNNMPMNNMPMNNMPMNIMPMNIMPHHKEMPIRNNTPMNNMVHRKEIPMRNNMPMNNMPHHKEMQMPNNMPHHKEMPNIPGISMHPDEAYERFHR